MREEWYIDRKKHTKEPRNLFDITQSENSFDKVRKNIVDYQYRTSSIDIKMRHFVHVNLFALKTNGDISVINPKRGYAIIGKWKHATDSCNLSIVGDSNDIKIDNLFACGNKIRI